jgi:hypothetical protein
MGGEEQGDQNEDLAMRESKKLEKVTLSASFLCRLRIILRRMRNFGDVHECLAWGPDRHAKICANHGRRPTPGMYIGECGFDYILIFPCCIPRRSTPPERVPQPSI